MTKPGRIVYVSVPFRGGVVFGHGNIDGDGYVTVHVDGWFGCDIDEVDFELNSELVSAIRSAPTGREYPVVEVRSRP